MHHMLSSIRMYYYARDILQYVLVHELLMFQIIYLAVPEIIFCKVGNCDVF